MTYAPVIQRAVEEADRARERAIKHSIIGGDLERAAEKFSKQHYYLSFSWTLSWSVKLASASELTRIATFLRGWGYRVKEFKDHPEGKYRSYKYECVDQRKQPESGKYGQAFTLYAHFDGGEDTTCQYVEVGIQDVPATEATTKPIYELRCGDESVTEEIDRRQTADIR